MAIVTMQKALVIAHKDEADSLVSFLQKKGSFGLSVLSEKKAKKLNIVHREVENSDTDLRLAEISFALRIISPYDTGKKSLKEKLLGTLIAGKESEVENVLRDFNYSAIVEKCNNIEEAINHENSKVAKMTDQIATLSAWKNLNFSPTFDYSSRHAEMYYGDIVTADVEDFAIRLSRIPLAHMQKVNENEKKTYFLVVFHKDASKKVEGLLETFHFSEMTFSDVESTPREEIEFLENERSIAEKKIKVLKKDISELVPNLKNLKLAYDYYMWEKDKSQASENIFATGKTIIMEGFLPKDDFDDTEKEIIRNVAHAVIIPLETEKEDSVPIKLKNNSFFAPFEIVTNMFGLPQKYEIDPTPYLAPFFAIFFGFCLTDAGYGLLLVVLTALAMKFMPLDKSTRKMTKLLFICGFTTIGMGILFGGWFGLTVNQVPSFLTNGDKFIGQMFDPMKDLTNKIMPMAFGMGFIQLLFGVFLSGVIKIKNGKIAEAVQTSFLLIVFILFTVLMFIVGANPVMTYILYGLLVLLIWGMGYGNKNPIVRILMGIIKTIDEAMSWLSNVLSYSRLFALGLATGIIATIFNSLAITFGSMAPIGLNVIVIVVILFAGHTINIGLNLLGAFIHSGRLQFVEFFGKFAEFGGKEFAPLERKGKYLFSEK